MNQEEQQRPVPQKPIADGGDGDDCNLAAEREKAATIGNSAADIVAAALSNDPKKFLKANTQPSGQ